MSETRLPYHTPEYLDFLKKLEVLKQGEKLLHAAVVRDEVSPHEAERLIHAAYDNIAQHPGAVSAFVLCIRENNTLDRLVLTREEHVPDASELAAKTAAFVAAQPKIHSSTVPAAQLTDDTWNQSAAYKIKSTAKNALVGGLAGFAAFGAAILGDQLEKKGVDVTVLYSAIVGTIALGHGMNIYDAWRKARPEYAAPAPSATKKSGGIHARICAGIVSLCALLNMMTDSATSYTRETAKPHEVLRMIDYERVWLRFPNDLSQ